MTRPTFIRTICICSALLLLATVLWRPAVGLQDGRAAQGEIRAAIDQFYAAADQQDWDAAGKLMAEDFVIFIDGGESFGKTDYVALLKADDLVVESLTLRDVEIAVSDDGSMAWSRYKADVASVSNGERHDVSTLETLVFGLIEGTWQIRHAHVALAPFKPGTQSDG